MLICTTDSAFDFCQERFPDPKSLVDDLHGIGFKAVWMLDPGIKCEEGYLVYDSGSENDVWIQKADGKPYIGKFHDVLFFFFFCQSC